MPDLPPDAEAAIAAMSDGEFAALTAKVRAPDATEQIRTAAAKFLTGGQLDAFVSAVNPAAFVDAAGTVQEDKVAGHLTAFFATGDRQPRQWGQGSAAGGPSDQPGDSARAALKKRHNVGADEHQPAAGAQINRAQSARAALAKRYPNKGDKR